MGIKAEKRISEMEAILDTANKKLEAFEKALSELEEYQLEIKRLEAYYTSDDWKKDYALDEAGELPPDLKRGVLSEDGIYNMLEKNKEFLSWVGENCKRFC
jgi:hypothetical protein